MPSNTLLKGCCKTLAGKHVYCGLIHVLCTYPLIILQCCQNGGPIMSDLEYREDEGSSLIDDVVEILQNKGQSFFGVPESETVESNAARTVLF